MEKAAVGLDLGADGNGSELVAERSERAVVLEVEAGAGCGLEQP